MIFFFKLSKLFGGGDKTICLPPQYFHWGRLPPAPQDRRLWGHRPRNCECRSRNSNIDPVTATRDPHPTQCRYNSITWLLRGRAGLFTWRCDRSIKPVQRTLQVQILVLYWFGFHIYTDKHLRVCQTTFTISTLIKIKNGTLKVVDPFADILKHHTIMQGWKIYLMMYMKTYGCRL